MYAYYLRSEFTLHWYPLTEESDVSCGLEYMLANLHGQRLLGVDFFLCDFQPLLSEPHNKFHMPGVLP